MLNLGKGKKIENTENDYVSIEYKLCAEKQAWKAYLG